VPEPGSGGSFPLFLIAIALGIWLVDRAFD
jgi:hypothetical protein